MFFNTVDIVVKTYLDDIIDKKLISKATHPPEFKNIKQESACPFSKFANKFNLATIKSCDGVNALFEKSLLVKSCADFHLDAKESTFESRVPADFFEISDHPHRQIQVTPFKFYPKILYPALLDVKKDIKLLLHKAYYHSKSHRLYPTGIVGGEFQPNIIMELEQNTEDFIEYLEPLVYLTALTDKKIKVHYEHITKANFAEKRLMFARRRFSRHTVM